MKTTIGKRTIYAAGLAFALPFGLAACGDAEDVDNDIIQDEQQDQEQEAPHPADE